MVCGTPVLLQARSRRAAARDSCLALVSPPFSYDLRSLGKQLWSILDVIYAGTLEADRVLDSVTRRTPFLLDREGV